MSMTELLAHRGPDGSGVYARGNVGLGHRRLSILDLSQAGRQPMANEDGTVWMVYNGECYNYKDFYEELRSRGHRFASTSDTEVLLHLYEDNGIGFLDRIRGMFALAIWDGRRKRLILARDRIGIKPLFYYFDKNHIVFASEMKSLLLDPAVPCDMDFNALEAYLRVMSIPDPYTIFKGVHKLLPGHYLCAEAEDVTVHKYWDVESTFVEGQMAGEAHWEREFSTRFRDAIRAHLVADVPVGSFLSGGVDSSSIVAMAQKSVSEPLQTFSIAFNNLPEFDEAEYARTVAQHCNTRHMEIDFTPNLIEVLPKMVWHCDEPFAVSSALGVYFLAQVAQSQVKVVLSGDGADEVFGGYSGRHGSEPLPLPIPLSWPRHVANSLLSHGVIPARHVPYLKAAVRSLLTLWSGHAAHGHSAGSPRLEPAHKSYLKTFTVLSKETQSKLVRPELLRVMREDYWDSLTEKYYNTFSSADHLTRQLYTDLKSTLVSEMLTKVDRMTMAWGLEARVPFLDHELVEWAFTVPSLFKVRGDEGKIVVKKAMEPFLPPGILYRPKHGFNVPLKVWWTEELKEFARDWLSESRIKARGLFKPQQVLYLLDNHLRGGVDYSNHIFTLLVLELWFEQFNRFRSTSRREGAKSLETKGNDPRIATHRP